jgi:hypothetical protein
MTIASAETLPRIFFVILVSNILLHPFKLPARRAGPSNHEIEKSPFLLRRLAKTIPGKTGVNRFRVLFTNVTCYYLWCRRIILVL